MHEPLSSDQKSVRRATGKYIGENTKSCPPTETAPNKTDWDRRRGPFASPFVEPPPCWTRFPIPYKNSSSASSWIHHSHSTGSAAGYVPRRKRSRASVPEGRRLRRPGPTRTCSRSAQQDSFGNSSKTDRAP